MTDANSDVSTPVLATQSEKLDQRISEWVRPEIRALSAYHVANPGGALKLDAMESPFDLPDAVRDQQQAFIRQCQVNRYPDPAASNIESALRQLYNLDDSVAMLFGNGSDELIQILAMVLGGPGRTVMALEPSFVMYRMTALFTHSRYIAEPLKEDFSIDLEAFLRRIEEVRPALIFIAQPNNPTGNLYAEEDIRAILQAAPGVVVLDEAYTPFTDADCLRLLAEYDNLLVMRTFSKIGLAGARFGMLFGNGPWIKELNKVRLPYNINSLTQQLVLTAINNFPLFEAQANVLREQRSALFSALKARAWCHPYPSQANFVLVRVDDSAKAVHEAMLEEGVLVKCLDGGHPALQNCLRFTVGTAEENEIMLRAFDRAWEQLKSSEEQ